MEIDEVQVLLPEVAQSIYMEDLLQSQVTTSSTIIEEKVVLIEDHLSKMSMVLSSIYITLIFLLVVKFLWFLFAKVFFSNT